MSSASQSSRRRGVHIVEIGVVVFVVARHVNHRRRPAMARRKAGEAEIGLDDAGARLIGADIARKHQQVGPRRGRDPELGMHFQVQVRKQLELHAGQSRRISSCTSAHEGGLEILGKTLNLGFITTPARTLGRAPSCSALLPKWHVFFRSNARRSAGQPRRRADGKRRQPRRHRRPSAPRNCAPPPAPG